MRTIILSFILTEKYRINVSIPKAPIKAAATVDKLNLNEKSELILLQYSKTMATPKSAPLLIPKISGPTNEFRNKV